MSIVNYQDNRSMMTFNNFEESMQWATLIAKSKLCPSKYSGDPGSVLIAIQFGRELGLLPMQSLQNIAVINGIPSVYGDTQLAICQNAPDFEDMIETFCEKTMTATCTIKRKGKADLTRTFSKEKAMKASLWGKAGPWVTYPERMLQMRARGFALRDAYSNLLKGLISVEEAQDYPEEKVINDDVEIISRKEQIRKVKNTIEAPDIVFGIEDNKLEDKKITNLHEELIKLISQKGISRELQDEWLARAKVKDIYSLDEGKVFNLVKQWKQKPDVELDSEDVEVINIMGGKK